MPSGIEATLQQLDLAAGKTATTPDSQPSSSPAYVPQHQGHSTPEQQDPETPAALQNTACLAATFSWLDDEQSLLQCAAVCQLWHSVLDADDIWRRVYLRSLPEPSELERVGRCVCEGITTCAAWPTLQQARIGRVMCPNTAVLLGHIPHTHMRACMPLNFGRVNSWLDAVCVPMNRSRPHNMLKLPHGANVCLCMPVAHDAA
jgi:hypothetical protein